MARAIRSFVLVIACLHPATAAADWFVSPFLGVRFASDTTFLTQTANRNPVAFGSSVGFLSDHVLGVEADVAFVPGFFESTLISASGTVLSVTGNVILTTPLALSQYGLRPYFVGGLGLLHARVASTQIGTDNSSQFGMTLGGGAIGPLTPRTSVRFEIRYFKNLSQDEAATDLLGNPANLSFWRATVGLAFRF